jgi:hypothetical protein
VAQIRGVFQNLQKKAVRKGSNLLPKVPEKCSLTVPMFKKCSPLARCASERREPLLTFALATNENHIRDMIFLL